MLDARLIGDLEALEPLREVWDRLPLTRGAQADLYDTHAWLSAFLGVAEAGVSARVRVPTVWRGDRLVAALPMLEVRPGRWGILGQGYRPRFRPVVDGGDDLDEILGALAETCARAGARDLQLLAMPSRDPATAALRAALERCGYRVEERPGSTECLTHVEGDWADHARRFRKVVRTVKNFTNKAGRIGQVELESWDGAGEADWPNAGFEGYIALHRRGWKGALGDPMERHRRHLLARAGARGWARLYLLRVAGVEAAAIIWFRIGASAIAYSTVYDQRLAALSPGTIVMWMSHERVFEAGKPEVVDYLPGHGPQKDQLGLERPGLLTLDARRVRGATGWVRASAARVGRAGARLIRARRRAGTSPEKSAAVEVAARRFEPDVELKLFEPEVDARLELFLAVAGGYASPKRMREGWRDGDRWLAIGEAPEALARVGVDGAVREIVLLRGSETPDRVLGAIAARRGEPVEVLLEAPGSGRTGEPVPVHRAVLPLSWDLVASH